MEGVGDSVISWQNFLTESLTIPQNSLPLYLFFSRKDFYSQSGGDCEFGNLSAVHKRLIKCFTYLTHCYDGSIYLCYLEPSFVPEQHISLPPPLRCALTGDFCLIFILNTEAFKKQTESNLFEETDCNFDEILKTIETDFHTKDHLVAGIKRLICMDKQLVSSKDLYANRGNQEYYKDLMTMISPDLKQYVSPISRKMIQKYDGGYLLNTQQRLQGSQQLSITKERFVISINNYFANMSEQDENDQMMINGDDCVWFCLTRCMTPLQAPLFNTIVETCTPTPSLNFLRKIHKEAHHGTILSTKDLLVFKYNLEDMIEPNNFDAFGKMPLYGYPFVNPNTTTKMPVTLKDFVKHIVVTGQQPKTNYEQLRTDGQFKIVFPHLAPIKGIVEELEKSNLETTTEKKTPLEQLRIRTHLFVKIMINNASKIPIKPVNGYYEQLKILSEKSPSWFEALSLSANRILVINTGRFHTSAPRMYEAHVFKTIFVTLLKLTRCVQASLSFTYILHNTAPKWKRDRSMLVNFTRGGQGKTYTNNALRLLFGKIVGILEDLSTFTDASLKYSALHTSKVMFMDDVGFSGTQQKNLKQEHNIIAAQFKSILDNGYTVNNTTEKNSSNNKFTVTTHISVHNTGFIWNTNTLQSFSDAWTDRCLILGPEKVKKAFNPTGESFLKEKVQESGADEIVKILFLRQHLIQSLIFTLTNESIIMPEHNMFLGKITEIFKKSYPAIQTNGGGSVGRDCYKLIDMAVGDSLKLALTAVLDLWIPPWTKIPPSATGETVETFYQNLHTARNEAMKKMDLSDMILEVLAQQQLFLPSSILQMAAIVFNQDTNSTIHRVGEFLFNVINNRKVDLSVIRGESLVIDQPPTIDENIETDWHLIRKGKTITVNKSSTESTRIINGFKFREPRTLCELHIDPWVCIEVLKNQHSDIISNLLNDLISAFETKYLEGLSLAEPILYNPIDHIQRNLLSIYSHIDKNIFTQGQNFLISPLFSGVGTELLRRISLKTNCDNPDGFSDMETTLKFHSYEGTVKTGETLPKEFINSQFNQPQIKSFDDKFLHNEELRGLFEHSQCLQYAFGDMIKIIKPHTDPTTEHSGWEYKCAATIYNKYTGKTLSETDMKEHLCRYLLITTSTKGLVTDDPYLSKLLRHPNKETTYDAHYGLKHIEQQIGKNLKRKHVSKTNSAGKEPPLNKEDAAKGSILDEPKMKISKSCQDMLLLLRNKFTEEQSYT